MMNTNISGRERKTNHGQFSSPRNRNTVNKKQVQLGERTQEKKNSTEVTPSYLCLVKNIDFKLLSPGKNQRHSTRFICVMISLTLPSFTCS